MTQEPRTEKGVLLCPSNTTGVSGELPPEHDPENDEINQEKLRRLQQGLFDEMDLASENADIAGSVGYLLYTEPRVQETTMWCGVACCEQVLRADFSEGHTMNTSNGTYQEQLAAVVGLGRSEGTEPYQHVRMLNAKTASNFRWGYRHISGAGLPAARATFNCAIQTIRDDKKCCIVFADTAYYDYYNGNQYYHWVTLYGVSRYTGTTEPSAFRVCDPHFNSAYRGRHEITPVSFGNAIERYNEKPNLVW